MIEEKGEIIEKKNLELIELKKSLEVLTEENEAFRNNQKHIHFEIELAMLNKILNSKNDIYLKKFLSKSIFIQLENYFNLNR